MEGRGQPRTSFTYICLAERLLVSEEMLCAREQGKDACQGDSGGNSVENN